MEPGGTKREPREVAEGKKSRSKLFRIIKYVQNVLGP